MPIIASVCLLLLVSTLAGCAGTPGAGPAPIERGQHAHTFQKEITRTVGCQYLLYLPDGYDPADKQKRWPLMLFLHGAGERGEDVNRVAIHGPPRLIREGRSFPFIVVSPLCPANEVWNSAILSLLLDDIEATYAVDKDRVYVTGLSMGGYGTWTMATTEPDRFAAAVPICGGGTPLLAGRLRNVLVWAFHGAKDDVVPLSESQRMVDALKSAGGNVKFTIYPEAKHDSWTETYNNPELYEWLLQQRRAPQAEK